MNSKEVITLSSDDENELQVVNTQSIPTKNEGSSSKTFSKLCLKNNKTFSKDEQLLLRENVNKDLQIVDLVVGSNYIPESKASTQENNDCKILGEESNETVTQQKVVKGLNLEENKIQICESLTAKDECNINGNVNIRKSSDSNKTFCIVPEKILSSSPLKVKKENEKFRQFVDKCVSLEDILSDKERLSKKLYKYYNNAHYEYTQSADFCNILEKYLKNINADNLYLIAKEVTDELSLRKKIEIVLPKVKDNVNSEVGDIKINQKLCKREKIIIQIEMTLDKLGQRIQELEETEVDLSDEEESSYVQLQRYRERYCTIYKKLCAFTNQTSDANRLCSRKIYFDGTKHLAINKCIEQWLNKTKKFPDFNDILKLLESQGDTLDLPSNPEALRRMATDIFQEVGAMLQRRRMYDLWDSLSGFLHNEPDPAASDPELEKVLKQNFEFRVKKEQEIIAYYADMQDQKKLIPEDVPENTANLSPEDSNGEDEKEIEAVEESIYHKLDVLISKDEENVLKEIDEKGHSTSEENSINHGNNKELLLSCKKTKNDYKNCKSLKWRTEKTPVKEVVFDSKNNLNLDESSENIAKETVNIVNEGVCEDSKLPKDEKCLSVKLENEMAVFASKRVPLIKLERVPEVFPTKKRSKEIFNVNTTKRLKKDGSVESEPVKKKKKIPSSVNEESEVNKESCCANIYEVRYFQFLHDYRKCSNFSYSQKNEKSYDRRVFRDLTNVSSLLKRKGNKNKIETWRTPAFFHTSIQDINPIWKKQFRINGRFFVCKGQKHGLNKNEKSQKNVNKSGKNSQTRNSQKSSKGSDGRKGEEGSENQNCQSGHGNGNNRDNNENDENKKKKTKQDSDEGKTEDDDDDENEEEVEDENDSAEGLKIDKPTVETSRGRISLGETSSVKNFKFRKSQAKAKNGEQRSNTETWNPTEQRLNFDEYNDIGTASNLITAEATIGENVIQAKVTLEESLTALDILPMANFEPDPSYLGASCSASSRNRSFDLESIFKTFKKRKTSQLSDEERVKRFLLHSPSSISITPPKNSLLPKSPSEDVLKALQTLRRLKDISTTRVRRQRNVSEEVVVGVSNRSQTSNSSNSYPSRSNGRNSSNKSKNTHSQKTRKTSNIEEATTPKIFKVQGNVSDFVVCNLEDSDQPPSDSTSIVISSVWGSLPNAESKSHNDGETGMNVIKDDDRLTKDTKKKNCDEEVECVVLD